MSAMASTVTPPRQIEPPCWSAFVPLPSDAVHILKVVSQDIDETKYGAYKSATNPCCCHPDFQTRENFNYVHFVPDLRISNDTSRELANPVERTCGKVLHRASLILTHTARYSLH